jgi:L-asparagine oxygenase
MLNKVILADEDRKAVRDLLVEIRCDPKNLEESSFLERAALFAQELPVRIREAFYEFKLRESSTVLLITNNPVSPEDVGPTPQTHWRPGESRPLNLPQVMHGLYSSLLGEPFGFDTQQRGRVFNDLIPIRGEPANSSSGGGDIGLHTEDVSQPFMPDYLGLACLRNDERAATTFSSLWQTKIPEAILRVLFEERFPVKRHLNASAPATRSVLFGDPKRPYLRYGSIDYDKCNSEMAYAMRFISTELERNRQSVTLSQGDCLYLDNFISVHGRATYQPNYNSNGRWFGRLVIARDLRATRAFRAAPDARVMLKSVYQAHE